MQTENPSDLTAVVKEIVEALLRSDWTRYSDDSGRFYYVIRETNHSAEVLEQCAFDRLLMFEKPEADYFEEWYIRAALAEAPADHLAKARKRVAAAGVRVRLFDDVIRASRAENSPTALMEAIAQWLPHFLVDKRLETFSTLMGAIRVDRTR